MTYTSIPVGNNMYQIETRFNDDPITFNVVVASDESEVEVLVGFHLNGLATPTVYADPVELTPAEKLASAGLTVDELKELLGIA